MAHKKSGGAVKGNRDSIGKRLGVKIFGSQKVAVGEIIVRQRGTKFFPGQKTAQGRDHTIFAKASGLVQFGYKKGKRIVSVISSS